MELKSLDYYNDVKYTPLSDDKIAELKSFYNSGELFISYALSADEFMFNFPQVQFLPYLQMLVLKKRKLHNFYYVGKTFQSRFNDCKIISDEDACKIVEYERQKSDFALLWEEKTEQNFIPVALLMQDDSLIPTHYVRMSKDEYNNVMRYIKNNHTQLTSSWFCDMSDWKLSEEESDKILMAENYSDLLYIHMNLNL